MKYFALILLLSVGFGGSLQAQEVYNSSGARMASRPRKQEQKGFDKDKLIYGGGLKFNFFGGGFRAGVTPVLGYRLTDRFAAGIGLGYQYDSQQDYYVFNTPSGLQTRSLRRHMIMPTVWVRAMLFENIFVQVEGEYDLQNYRGFIQDSDPNSSTYAEPVRKTQTISTPALLVGPGFRQQIGEYSSLYALIMYDVVQDVNSPYYRLLDYRIGVNFGW
jgi:hypothetical protein